ncbi:MAG: hypothetical protein KA165_13120 [Saprospiraceae bacterium]|nr:hypothetical protein [Saprospiraceae bacterium]
MDDHNIIDRSFHRPRTEAEESEFQLLKLDAANAVFHIRNARITLFVLAAIWGIIAAATLFTGGEAKNEIESAFNNAISFTAIFLSVVFGISAWLARKKPVVCLTVGLVLFALLFVVNTLQSFSILGFLLGAVVVYLLLQGFMHALKIKTIIQAANTMGATEAEIFEV